MHVTNRMGLPEAIVAAVKNDPYPHGRTGDISVTRLIAPPRLAALERAHWHEIEEDASDRVWSLLGQSVHTILERAEPLAETEKRLFAQRLGWTISGQVDRLAFSTEHAGAVVIEDYKVTSAWAVLNGLKDEWRDQLHALQWLAERNGYQVSGLRIVAILRDWSKHQTQRSADYPRAPVVPFHVDPMRAAELDAWIGDRVQAHQAARERLASGDDLPDCTDAERWARPTTYAVMKQGRKSAVKRYQLRAVAEAHASTDKALSVEVRPGEAVRCAHYCPVARWCRQWQTEQQATD